MSGFWEAIGRAALGRPGAATPRPRSIYEPEVSRARADEIEATDDDANGAAGAPGAERTAAPARAPSRAKPPSRAEPASDLADRPVPASEEEEAEVPAAGEPSPAESRAAAQASPLPPRAERRSEGEPAVTSVVERVEVHRLESTEILARTIASTRPEESRSLTLAAPPAPPAVGASPEPDDEVEAAPRDRDESALAVVAKPPVAVAEPASSRPEPVEPPLVIEIDHIDIRIEPERVAPVTPARRRDTGTAPPLSDYLERYGAASR